ncbi:hypothetical protein [Vibrio phage vB_VmeM-Yong XC32]|nr:hypothetical protein [Vibrio phage vB_VmeM-Yong XC31]QAX96444.1 hypothetical protein [Vibrio phage vB_VmeM-Yong XC32]QAX96761.1 hypothetical protein [Vibrio phage vB_VmeM-Yong MS31]QAX97080.1 hypothetical protein [Vibrio phage vB_VmeM-Yong MS32]
MPIRKTKPNQAALTSYAGKVFISRSELAKHDQGRWLRKAFSAAALTNGDDRVTSLRYGTNKIPNVPLPRHYTSFMSEISGFDSGAYKFDFEYEKREQRYGEKAVANAERSGAVVCGTYDGAIITMNMDNTVNVPKSAGGSILELTGGGWGTPPSDVAIFRSLNRKIPVVMFLGYTLGLDKLLRKLKVRHRWEPLDRRVQALQNEIVISFADERLYVDVKDPMQSLIWSGLKDMEEMTRRFNVSDFNRRDGWVVSLPYYKANKGHADNWTLMNDLFLDPITLEVLADMKEPDNLVDLFIRCCELIKTDDAPDEADPKFMRVRGMERISGLLYLAMYEAIAAQRRMPNSRNEAITLMPSELRNRLNADSSVQLVSEVNPVHNLKEQEAITLAGEGGRSARTLVKRNRVFHENDLGILSEHTPDSAKVGIRGFATPNARINDLRGTAGTWTPEDGSSALLSTTALLFPDMDRDDGKRANLGAVQQSAVVPTAGSHPMPYRSGYDSIIASRVSEFFVYRAKEAGEVTKVTDKVIRVKYASGREEGYRLGVKHGSVAGELIPHEYVTDKVVGSTFEEGWVLAWNSGFFARELTAPENVSMLSGALATVVLKEGNDTLEDGSAISENFRKKLSTRISKNKGIILDFDQEIEGLVTVGQEVEFDTILGTIKEGTLTGLEQTDASLLALSKLSNQTPKAKTGGVVTRIEVFYMGNIDDMSESLRAIVEADNARRAEESRDLNRGAAGRTGELRKPTYVAGEKVIPGKVVISVYIDSELESGIGDKSVVSNQLKTVHGRIMEGINRTEDGRDIDLVFGAQSVNNRIVTSCISQGVINAVVRKKNQQLVDMYFSEG